MHTANILKMLLLITTCSAPAENLSISRTQSLIRFKRGNNCSIPFRECKSGECIHEISFCDGKENCQDGSDENVCSKQQCASFAFQCAYGACINKKKMCDGKRDCKDNSDEVNCSKVTPNMIRSCSNTEFICDNGECIADKNVCNGIPDCKDASDESGKICRAIKCPNLSFSCDYGACINSVLKCNGVNNCYDGSDEKDCAELNIQEPNTNILRATTTSTPASIDARNHDMKDNLIPTELHGCQLPPHPINGKWNVYGSSKSYLPGESVDNNAILIVTCDGQYSLYPNNKLLYCDGSWPDMPQCLKTCSSMLGNKNLNVKCTLNDSAIDCRKSYEGSIATLECTPLYEDRSLVTRPNRFCIDGLWDYGPANCEPICGLKSTEAKPLIIGGSAANQGDYPWMVGLYRMSDKSHICGGSMISPRNVLTAAHCFTESKDPKDYFVSAGNYYRKYQDQRDKNTQYRNVQIIKIHDKYSGFELFYGYDIAIVVVESFFKITSFVMPVCIDFNSKFEPDSLVGQTGIVTGWGFTTEIDTPSEVLKVLEVSVKTKETCSLPDDFNKFLEFPKDKLCGVSAKEGEISCSGDSGGALVFKQWNRYYVRGIVSVAPKNYNTTGCDANQPTLFTSVHYHAKLIQGYYNKYK